MNRYRRCAVPMCTSTTIKYPDKLFIHVPNDSRRRKQWLQLARRDPKFTSVKSTIFFCQDHFDLPNDMENYIKYTVMGSVDKIRMKPDCLPSRFECQPDRTKRTAPPQPRSVSVKRQRMETLQEIISQEKENEMPGTSRISSNSDYESSTEKNECFTNFQDKLIQACPDTTDKIVQICLTKKHRSKATQTESEVKDKNTSPFKANVKSTATSPIKVPLDIESSMLKNPKSNRRLLFGSEKVEVSSSNSSTPSKQSKSKTDTSSIQSLLLVTSTSSDQEMQNELAEIKKKCEEENFHQMSIDNTLRLIKNNPRYYTGIPKDCYFLITIIKKHTNLPEEHKLLCLKKIRLNTPFSELGDQFGISLSYASKIFMKSIPIIKSVLLPFIIRPSRRTVKLNLPMAFRHNYSNIYCIIDCLEIEIQKPTKSVEQALTWSEYKKANTAKYLISSTPDGIINFISCGYSGRVTDVELVQNCNFLDCLEPGVSILADRGFKHIEGPLLQKGINLVRPPSVSSNSKLSKQDVIRTKQIASLRIHIERVIRRLREFSMLKPHSVVNSKLLRCLDDCVVIACALLNLQDSLIKNT